MECLGAGSLVGCPLVESLDSAKDGFTSTISGFRMPSAPRCSVRGAARFARRTTVHFHHEQTTYESVGPKIKVCASSWIQEELARNLQQIGWSITWKVEARLPLPYQPLAQSSLSALSICNGDAALRAESGALIDISDTERAGCCGEANWYCAGWRCRARASASRSRAVSPPLGRTAAVLPVTLSLAAEAP